jgi:hypothetical protein
MRSRFFIPVLLVLALAGTGLVLYSNHRFGVGLTHDSIHYIAAARNLAAGRGLVGFDGTPYVDFPPLFPLLLAAPAGLGLDPLVGARLLNALVFGLIVLCGGLLFRRVLRSTALALAGTAALLVGFPLLTVSVMAWSEPLFALLVLLMVMVLAKGRDEGAEGHRHRATGWGDVLLLGMLGALACLQRYAGAFVVAGVALALLLKPTGVNHRGTEIEEPGHGRGPTFTRRAGAAAVFVLVALAPLVAWLVRNAAVKGTWSGPRPEPFFSFGQSFVVSAQAVLEWFVPWIANHLLGWLSVVVVLAGAAGVGALLVLRRRRDRGPRGFAPVAAFIILLVYALALSLLTLRVGVGPFTRMLAPFYPLAILAVLAAIEGPRSEVRSQDAEFRAAEPERKGKRALHVALLVLAFGWLAYPASRLAWLMPQWQENGVGVYDAVEWQELGIVKWLKQNRVEGRVLSNDPGMVYLLTGNEAHISPRRTDDAGWLAGTGQVRPGDWLVWFSRVKRPYLYTVPELAGMFPLEEVTFVGDGGVLRFTDTR